MVRSNWPPAWRAPALADGAGRCIGPEDDAPVAYSATSLGVIACRR